MPHACSKVPDHKPYPTTQPKTFPSAIPFILYQGADDEAEDTYVLSGENADHGIFKPDLGEADIIQFRHEVNCPPPPVGFALDQVVALDFREQDG